ncbi:MAG TPA: divergent PAP2 family protein [Oculatellaceae cyanobacterium]|jgi:acid phosphatase family membrane protein YuiD
MSNIAGTSLEVLTASVLAASSAQVIKCCIYFIINKPVTFRTLVQTGGMPSSHSALVAGLATSVGLIEGFYSTTFAVAMGFAMIVMYDAAGLRQAAGRMAGILNKLTEDIYRHRQDYVPVRLRELLGHTPYEVIAGACLGVLCAYLVHLQVISQ